MVRMTLAGIKQKKILMENTGQRFRFLIIIQKVYIKYMPMKYIRIVWNL